ncbi:MAG TPA: GyrI-like domain-containing protein [Anaerolineaceae bacterium]|nr:GyrI-like domain-containing protein [Anaerolineaceae bacterium]
METLDLRKQLKSYYAPSAKKVEALEIPAFNFLMIDGNIEKNFTPGTSLGFQEAIGALYGAAYTLKFMLKQRKEDPVDYPVMALEGQWWVEDGHFDITVKDNWFYTLMILQPDLITPDLFAEALAKLRKKKGDQPIYARLRLERFQEGLCMQVMHLGPYDAEPATVTRMDEFAQANGYRKCGKHHEIYLGNPLSANLAKLKTILRHPIQK